MEELEQMLLEKGITNEAVQQLQKLEHELLKLKEAAQEQGKENKRESKTNTKKHPKPTPKQLEFKNKYYKQNEILNREVLPMKGKYKKKVKVYFSKELQEQFLKLKTLILTGIAPVRCDYIKLFKD